jgi:hypothetical protein
MLFLPSNEKKKLLAASEKKSWDFFFAASEKSLGPRLVKSWIRAWVQG